MSRAQAGDADMRPAPGAETMKIRGAIVGTALLALGILTGVWIGDSDKNDGTVQAANAPPPLTITVVRAQQGALADAVQVVGQTRSREDVRVVAELAGLRVERIEVEAGDEVHAGQVLAVLDGRGLRIDSEKFGSELLRAQGEYERARVLVASQLVSREFFKQKQTTYEVARAQHEGARLSVQRTRVVAPASGRVVSRNVVIGDLTDPTRPLFEIAREGVIELEANVPETLVARLRQGMLAHVDIAGRSEPVRGDVRLIQPNVDTVTRETKVRIRLDTDAPIPVGAFGQATIDVARIEGWLLPRSALQEDEAGRYVWRVGAKGIVSRRAVTPTFRTADMVVVAEALGDEAIVAKAGPFLRENDRVRIASGN
jgi:HlyD family secretion protein